MGLSEHSKNQKRGRPLDSFLEGPMIVDNTTLYLTDIPYGRIFALDLASKNWSLVLQYDGEPNGLAWHPHRKQLIIADFKLGILGLDPQTKEITPIMERFNGERLKGPNDVVVSRDGSIFFTDQGMSGLQDPSGRVYRLQPDGRVDILLRNCPSPNGLVLDRTETSLFVAMTRDNSIWHAPLYPDGSVQRTGRFSSYYGLGGPDGMTTDEEGNVFVAHSTLDQTDLEIWRDAVPAYAGTYEFLMDGIPAFASLHVALKNPEKRKRFTEHALSYHNSGLKQFSDTLPFMNPDNCDALFAFAVITALLLANQWKAPSALHEGSR
ncbi:hypothetical protein SLS56_011161 [Neofusicoccum ribis]|uniref:SMP-30/Gluconolactonase/LRE-like region domain-containing protein n=1 Tax=Neofusicoccum ribis TaxID=45134 RepID=A0ABR3SCG3_9PEZI